MVNSPVVLYETKSFAVIDKPAGMLVHPTDIKHNEVTVTEWLLKRYPEIENVGDDPKIRPGIVHRLDRDTSGVLLITRTPEAFSYFKRAFQEKTITKTYLALAWGSIKEREGIIDAPIGLKQGTTKRTVWQKKTRLIKEAQTKYLVKERYRLQEDPVTLVEVWPLTGRTHQIRVHLHSIGHPIVGDTLYGGKKLLEKSRALGITRQFLHAAALEFDAPDGTRLQVSSELPKELEQVLEKAQAVPEHHQQHN
jgi:23S rRNA pseudouridine1911/1915/1917 synthase